MSISEIVVISRTNDMCFEEKGEAPYVSNQEMLTCFKDGNAVFVF
jgi:hypothetical protein